MWIHKSRIRRSLALIFVLLAEKARCENADVTWMSPSDGDIFGPGDTIIGKWNAAQAIVSPSFRLCMPSGDSSLDSRATGGKSSSGCGSTVWPTVEQSAGSYFISLAVPNVTSVVHGFYLQMEDDFGSTIQSPVFSLSPKAAAAANTESNPPSGLADPSAVGTLPTPAEPSASAAGPTNASTNPAPTPSVPYVLATRSPPPTAAFAVPLSLVAAILLVAAGLSLHHRRKLGNERTRDAEQLALSRKSSLNSFKSSSTRSSDVEHALNVLSRNDLAYGASMPVPVFMPVDVRREPRQSTRQAYSPYITSPYHPTSQVTTTYPPRTSESLAHPPPERDYLPPIRTSARGLLDEDDDNATITHSVISSYMQPSPIPPPCLLSAPQRLHVRTEAVGPSLPSIVKPYGYADKPLPRSPQPGTQSAEDRNVYDAVSTNLGIYHQT